MASVHQRGDAWYVRYKDGSGRWRDRVTTARTKTEARKLAVELEQRGERERLGLAPRIPDDGGGTLAALMQWWLDTYSKGTPSHAGNVSALRKHIFTSAIASTTLSSLRSGHIETFLQSKTETLSPQSINHLRRFIGTAYNCAKRAGRYEGENPVVSVRKRRVPKRVASYLKADEVGPVLASVAPRWRNLFATAVYLGLRKGELIGLRKRDVDVKSRLLVVGRSYDRDTTKGGHADVLPIPRCAGAISYARN